MKHDSFRHSIALSTIDIQHRHDRPGTTTLERQDRPKVLRRCPTDPREELYFLPRGGRDCAVRVGQSERRGAVGHTYRAGHEIRVHAAVPARTRFATVLERTQARHGIEIDTRGLGERRRSARLGPEKMRLEMKSISKQLWRWTRGLTVLGFGILGITMLARAASVNQT